MQWQIEMTSALEMQVFDSFCCTCILL